MNYNVKDSLNEIIGKMDQHITQNFKKIHKITDNLSHLTSEPFFVGDLFSKIAIEDAKKIIDLMEDYNFTLIISSKLIDFKNHYLKNNSHTTKTDETILKDPIMMINGKVITPTKSNLKINIPHKRKT